MDNDTIFASSEDKIILKWSIKKWIFLEF
jgi:hypothetical protein